MNNNKVKKEEELLKNAIDALDIMKINHVTFTLPKNNNLNKIIEFNKNKNSLKKKQKINNFNK